MQLDRAFQLRILQNYAQIYPHWSAGKWTELEEEDKRKVIINLFYLQDHRLIEIKGQIGHGNDLIYQGGRITTRGMDFLQDDGGLSAVLGVVTVKLHEDSIKALIAQRIESSDLPPAEKSRWLEALRDMPAETTKQVISKLVEIGLDKAPDAIQTIGIWLHQVATQIRA